MEIETKTAKELSPFNRFAKTNRQVITLNSASKTVVAYTRVSSKEQANNMSLPYQRQVLDEYAIREGLTIDAYFGGKHESAKQSEGRKEFYRMLDYLKKNKGRISQVLVYTIDRFSRTGGEAIKLAEDLRMKYGVSINAISQPTDVSNPTGIFQQNIQFLFSNYDNTLRRQKIIAGMTYKLERGIWIVKPPMGYDIVWKNSNRSIEINENGLKLKKAFKWKAEGLKSEDIIKRLIALGVPMTKQKMSDIFKNPFYCGILAHNLLGARVVKGVHKPIISEELFLKVNNIQINTGQLGVPHIKENNDLPLKVFLKCDQCHKPLTGYMVQKKNLYYYKCRTIGCNCNKSNKLIHEKFKKILTKYSVKNELLEPLKYQLGLTFADVTKESRELEHSLKLNLMEVNKKLETIEEKYYALNQMDTNTFNKLNTRYEAEKLNILKELERSSLKMSNPGSAIEMALDLSCKLASIWDSGNVSTKEKLQNLIFPEGIYYNHKKDRVRTEKVNSVFSLIAQMTGILDKKETRQNNDELDLSGLVELRGVEPRSGEGTD
jgi:site-specific DNA recombinase